MDSLTIAVIGGTGPQGKGLAHRFAAAGHHLVVGSRSRERAAQAADEIRERTPGASVSADTNRNAAATGNVVLLVVPYDGYADLVASLRSELASKIVISCVNPLGFGKSGAYGLDVTAGSAAEEAAELVPDARVVGAFHHLSAANLWNDSDHLHHEDVLVCGDDAEAKAAVADLAAAVTGRRGLDAGPLRLARSLEPLTAVLVNINKRHKVRSGVAIVGLPEPR